MKPTFTIKLNQPVFRGQVVTGKFDGKTPSIACATTGGKVLIHSPHEAQGADGQNNQIRYLNLNRKITAMAAGQLGTVTDEANDLLFVGTESNLLAYDVERNADQFFVDVQDGVNTLAIGRLGHKPGNLVIAGGNCSIFGFDQKGNEAFWTVTGDNVSSLALASAGSLFENSSSSASSSSGRGGEKMLLVGSDDFEIRVFAGEEVVSEITEADRVTLLHSINPPATPNNNNAASSANSNVANAANSSGFVYGLANGTVGVYGNTTNRLWRVKTKHAPTAIFAYDIDLDGIPEIFAGWQHGALTVRKRLNGDLLYRENSGADGGNARGSQAGSGAAMGVAGILSSDYRLDGHEEVLVVYENGKIDGYLATDIEFGRLYDSGIGKENMADQLVLEELHNSKLELINELRNLEKLSKITKTTEIPVGALASNTNLNYILHPDIENKALSLRVEVNNPDVQIVNLIAVDLEGVILVEREVLAISPKPQSRTAILPLRPSRNAACKIRVQSHIAARSLGAQIHVFEKDIDIPKFAVFCQLQELSQYTIPTGVVKFSARESIERFVTWMKESFLLRFNLSNYDDRLKIGFLSVCRTSSGLLETKSGNKNNNSNNHSNFKKSGDAIASEGELVVLSFLKASESGQGLTKVKINCDNMELAADIIQDMAKYMKWDEMDSEADFPVEFEKFEEVLKTVSECNTQRINLTADMADDSQRIKALVIRAEDSRLMQDMGAMRHAYTELSSMNASLITSYNVRAQNHETLLASLKEVNMMIQKAANLRVGKAKARVISDCRGAVKANEMQALFRILKHGYEPSGAYSNNSGGSGIAPGKN